MASSVRAELQEGKLYRYGGQTMEDLTDHPEDVGFYAE